MDGDREIDCARALDALCEIRGTARSTLFKFTRAMTIDDIVEMLTIWSPGHRRRSAERAAAKLTLS